MAKISKSALIMHPVVRDELLRTDHIERLARVTDLVRPEPFTSIKQVCELHPDIEVLITSWGCEAISQPVSDALPRLKLIAHMAGSVKGFIDDVLWRRGVLVCNAVAANALPVAEFTLAAILFANKRVFALNHAYLKTKANHAPWTKEAPNVGNYNKVIGIIGASHVGQRVVELLQPFDLKVLLYDPFVSPSAARVMGATKVGLTELLTQADVVSLHAPLLNDTAGMMGMRELALMRSGATLINTARGGLVDQFALEAEVCSQRLYAVLDTTTPEVLPADSVLYTLPNVYLTPHITGSLGTETQRLADFIVAEIERYHKGAALKHLVRREHLARLA